MYSDQQDLLARDPSSTSLRNDRHSPAEKAEACLPTETAHLPSRNYCLRAQRVPTPPRSAGEIYLLLNSAIRNSELHHATILR